MSDPRDRQTPYDGNPAVLVGLIKELIDRVNSRVDVLDARLQEVEAAVQRLSSNVAPTEPE